MVRAATWLPVLILAVLALVAVAVLVRAVEGRLAFFPLRGESDTPSTFGVPFEALDLSTFDGERLRAWWMPHVSARATVLYLHGNGGNLSMWAPILVQLWHQGLAVLAVDYRGYGLSSGRPSERGLYLDTAAAAAAIEARADRSRAPLIYWGRSLGVVMAIHAARQKKPDGLILEAGFPSVRAVLEGSPLWLLSWFSSYSFPAERWLKELDVPTLVFHGDRDSVISFHLGQRLYEAVRGPKRFVVIPGGDHNDLAPPDPKAYWAAIDEFVQKLEARTEK
jgi:fermentation-respiration switch protein FrsA (DUF1100 family)